MNSNILQTIIHLVQEMNNCIPILLCMQ